MGRVSDSCYDSCGGVGYLKEELEADRRERRDADEVYKVEHEVVTGMMLRGFLSLTGSIHGAQCKTLS
jgi:hypothetical protein